ncbi:MAG TPA: NrsF family protein [Myxococcota bacterium]|nr:NrsF family protein [Myxococcota bacterium]
MSRDPTDALITSLARDLQPVRPVRPLRREVLKVGAVAGAVTVAVVAGLGLRPGLEVVPGQTPFVVMALGLAVFGLGSISAALAFARPGLEGRGVTLALGSVVSLLVCVAIAAFWLRAVQSTGDAVWGGGRELPCVLFSIALALPAALFATYLAASAAPIHSIRTSVLTAAGGTALGMVAAHLTCRTPGAWHTVLTHALAPMIGGFLLAAPLALMLRHWRFTARS